MSDSLPASILPIGDERRRGGTTNEERAKESLATLEANLDVYEQILSKQKYLAGNVGLTATAIAQTWC
jgi:glutathione S-transferase